ncbi:dimethylallyl, adenosine tRNA methylthiotransferase [Carex rostrata]
MARGVASWGRGKSCSYKKFTIAICFVNLFVALVILRSLWFSCASNSHSVSKKYTEGQIERIKESIRIREEAVPTELLKAVMRLRKEMAEQEKSKLKLPLSLKQKVARDIIEKLRSLREGSNSTDEIEAVEMWRIERLNDLKTSERNLSDLVSSSKEANMLRVALELNWHTLMDDIGIWIPANVTNPEHNDKPDNEPEEAEIIPGPPLQPVCNAELHTDYAGAAVRWGLTHHKESAADCCQACLDQAKHAKPGEMKCNIWVYCPSEFGCFSPDIYEHKHQECWLKMDEKPRINFKDKYSESYRDSHPTAPVVVPWMSGVISN